MVEADRLRAEQDEVKGRLAAEEKARATYRLFAEAIETVPASLMVYDADERLVICNSKAKQYYLGQADMLVPGLAFADFTRALAESGMVPGG